MDSSEVREHLEMADRIVAASTRTLSLGYAGPFFIIWGVFGAVVDVVTELWVHGALRQPLWLNLAALVLAILASGAYGRSMRANCKEPLTFVQREFLKALWVTILVTFVAEFAGGLFSGWSAAAIWNVATTIVLLFIASHGNLRALAAGIVTIAALFVANFTPGVEGYVLGAGVLVGYAGFGLAEMIAA